MNEIYLTKDGFKKLKKELDQLKTVKRRELSKAIAEARSHGDISENAEYDAAKEAQALNEKRIAELEEKLGRGRILDERTLPTDQVVIGTTVTLKDLTSGEEFAYRLVSESEADFAENKISTTSPVGRGLLNRKVNDSVEIRVPAGILKYKILKIG